MWLSRSQAERRLRSAWCTRRLRSGGEHTHWARLTDEDLVPFFAQCDEYHHRYPHPNGSRWITEVYYRVSFIRYFWVDDEDVVEFT